MLPTNRRLSGVIVFVLVFQTLVQAADGATISGQVQLAASPNDPASNARITLFTPSLTFFAETRSDASGSYSIEGFPEGMYQLGCAHLRFEYIEETVTIGPGGVQRDFDLEPESHPGQWNIIGTTAPEFLDATDIATLLPDGQIFYCHDTTDPILFDPTTGDRSFPAGSPSEQGCQNASLMSDGQIIMMGGQSPADPGSFTNAVRWTKEWSPVTETWQLLADMQHKVGRWYPGLARLADGSLLVMGGGQCCDASRTDTCERFDLATQTWSYTGSLVNPTEFPPAALLHTGEVLTTWWPPQLYNPTTEQWSLTGNFNQPNRSWPGHCDHSLVVLADGRALAIGVRSGPDGNTVMGEVYDPKTESWSLTSNPDLVRSQSEVVQLPDGRVFVGGGETEVDPPPVDDVLGIVRWCDLYDPDADDWRRVADMNWHREYHGVTLLVPDGRILMTGGTRIKFQVGPTSADIEAFSPPYLFRGVRPEISSISETDLPRGAQITIELAFATELTSIVLMGTQTTTHWVDGGIPRRLTLGVQQNGTSVTANVPVDPNVAILGHYMLFAMVDDIPSVAKIVRVLEALGPPTGACCFGNGFCTPQTQADCESVEGQVYLGDGTECVGDFSCPVVCWNCQCADGFGDSGQSAIGCVAEENSCNDLCQAHGGLQGFQCDLGACASIPAVSQWGVLVMILLTSTTGTLILRPRVAV